MKKVGIITIHIGTNFGSVLQTIATSIYIKSLGYFPFIINYIPPRATLKRYLSGALTSIKRMLWRTLNLPIFLINRKIYTSYLKKHVNLSDPFHSNDSLDSIYPKAEFYITGSDQVWNSIYNEGVDGHYYLDGIDDTVKKISLSSSFGRESLDDQEAQKVKKLLNRYHAISVREDSGVKILENIGIDSIQLLDPTFLLNRTEWMAYMSPRIEKEPYILIYTPYNTVDKEVIYQSARVLAKGSNKKIVSFSWNLKPESLADRTIFFANPGDFLSLMYHADFVITNSFHGTAFSINLNKQFWVFQPSAFSTRIESILNLTGLRGRMLTSTIEEENLTTIDYVPVNKILEAERGRSREFLSKNLK